MKALLTQMLTDDGESLPLTNFANSLRVAFMKFVTIRVYSRPGRAEGLAKADLFAVCLFICVHLRLDLFDSCIYELC
jgi:hypothetical protein